MISNPWSAGPRRDGLWISPEDQARVDRVNARLASDDLRRLNYLTADGKPLVPGAWSGNAWEAPIVLLLLNPAVSPYTVEFYDDGPAVDRIAAMAMGRWDPLYPNAWLHPDVRRHEPWCSRVVCAALHRHLVSLGRPEEEAWSVLSQKVALLELSPWTSFRWSHHAVVETTSTSVALARAAMGDPKRVVLLGRGESDWRTAGLVDVDLLPLSRGVRSNQSRITESNFPSVWNRIISALKMP